VLLVVAGCSRTHYRLRADAEAYSILTEKSASTPWRLPFGFGVEPDPRSRFYDATPTDDPWLPVPAPQLYAYSLPELPERDPDRFGGQPPAWNDPLPDPQTSQLSSKENQTGADDTSSDLQSTSIATRSVSEGVCLHLTDASAPTPRKTPPNANGIIQQVAYHADQMELTPENQVATDSPTWGDESEGEQELKIVPIPEDVWQSLPQSCLLRMFESASIREEYARTYGHEPTADQLDQSQRLTLEDIVELALINSRQYQTQKETLYRAALRLSLDRFDYDMKFATGGNRNTVDYSHNRASGITQNNLSVPTTITENAVLATGGDLLARFANGVVLTFNGPGGFAADVGSDLLLDISQRVFQRDIVLEGLTQAERDVIYAARNFVRFRKQLFADLARLYYSLLLTNRRIEIDAQDYFSNLRGFLQAQAEYRAGRRPRFEVDQFEQSALGGRSGLINSCNRLEGSLDNLKFDIGLPPELPLNLDLTELGQLTLRDEEAAAAERVRRAQRNLETERGEPEPKLGTLLNAAIDQVGKMLNLIEIRERVGQPNADAEALRLRLDELLVDEAELDVQEKQVLLAEAGQVLPRPQDLDIVWRTAELVDSLLVLMVRQLKLAERRGVSADKVSAILLGLPALRDRHEQLRTKPLEAVEDDQLDRIPGFVPIAETLLADAEALAVRAAALVPNPPQTREEQLQQILVQADELIKDSQSMLAEEVGGLVPVEIEMDDAMLTALTLRFDLMNERGALADDWRQIKLAGDDLKSILNLRAAQRIRTRSGVNRPFDFTFDDSQTQLSMTFDAPLNRKAQRNLFRLSLIDYNSGLRSLMASEDRIKLSVRDDLRQLEVDREQYRIAVARAALAYDQLVSTRMQLRLSLNRIRATDVLLAQQDYTNSLIDLAGTHIDYILNRVQFFHDLELLEVNDSGFWPMLYDEHFQPEPNYELPFHARPVYGELPRRTWHSRKIRSMLCVPAGDVMIFEPDGPQATPTEELPPPQPDQPMAPETPE